MGQEVQRLEPSHAAGESARWCSHRGGGTEAPPKITIPFQGLCSKESNSGSGRDVGLPRSPQHGRRPPRCGWNNLSATDRREEAVVHADRGRPLVRDTRRPGRGSLCAFRGRGPRTEREGPNPALLDYRAQGGDREQMGKETHVVSDNVKGRDENRAGDMTGDTCPVRQPQIT